MLLLYDLRQQILFYLFVTPMLIHEENFFLEKMIINIFDRCEMMKLHLIIVLIPLLFQHLAQFVKKLQLQLTKNSI